MCSLPPTVRLASGSPATPSPAPPGTAESQPVSTRSAGPDPEAAARTAGHWGVGLNHPRPAARFGLRGVAECVGDIWPALGTQNRGPPSR